MKKIICLVVLLTIGWVGQVYAQQKDSAQSQWLLDFEQAKVLAAEKALPIMIVFSGSDWCKPCIMLKRDILGSAEFEAYANGNMVLVLADFPRSRKNKLPQEQQEKNDALAEKYNQQGAFPHVVIVNAEGQVLATTGYLELSPAEYVEHITSLLK